MSASAHCIFCKIVRGEIPAIKVYEDDLTLAFMDIQPASPGHTLVISKAHAPTLLDIAEVDLLAVTVTTQRIAGAVQQALVPDGIRINQFNGTAAGQTVLHYHVHIIPMWEGQKIGAHGRAPADPDALKALAARIRDALQA
ncbi:MAG: HIT family protein [Candidatus Competibacteraceae bacterium]|uniref:Histidine triad (HIT) protein n=1 Tax=Candidatus Contendobacter odensis Run_B_J11 TaxID=1400861 RepID=A0A7U7GCX3_9GAMM|nr:HIT family protein [Candidatus Contendobacter odensis]MBK8534928.1 HIT family protein [Candidatus Competibacteraceae bacterium]MBK8753431.1 HIT family protein [Candidatus Competibacteraceae bacterium]CDH46104.1 Histidine triad (HIT) protein [Candidatus Contendobacter odensis Run_B_J11]